MIFQYATFKAFCDPKPKRPWSEPTRRYLVGLEGLRFIEAMDVRVKQTKFAIRDHYTNQARRHGA